LDCENESDEEGRGNEKSGRWKVSCHVREASENAEESDIVDAGETKKMRTTLVRRSRSKTDGTSSIAPATIPRSIFRSVVVSKPTSAPPTTPTTSPTTTLRPFRPLAFAHFVEAHPAITFGQCASIAFFGAAHLFFFLFHEAMGDTRRGTLCFDQ
jgi:hypothetical protein